MLTAIAETNAVTMTTVATMTAMVMTIGSVAELCCTEIESKALHFNNAGPDMSEITGLTCIKLCN